jgi:hypothetical protein
MGFMGFIGFMECSESRVHGWGKDGLTGCGMDGGGLPAAAEQRQQAEAAKQGGAGLGNCGVVEDHVASNLGKRDCEWKNQAWCWR